MKVLETGPLEVKEAVVSVLSSGVPEFKGGEVSSAIRHYLENKHGHVRSTSPGVEKLIPKVWVDMTTGTSRIATPDSEISGVANPGAGTSRVAAPGAATPEAGTSGVATWAQSESSGDNARAKPNALEAQKESSGDNARAKPNALEGQKESSGDNAMATPGTLEAQKESSGNLANALEAQKELSGDHAKGKYNASVTVPSRKVQPLSSTAMGQCESSGDSARGKHSALDVQSESSEGTSKPVSIISLETEAATSRKGPAWVSTHLPGVSPLLSPALVRIAESILSGKSTDPPT